LCPSTTETLIDLGLENSIIGRTIFCIHPKEIVTHIETIGGTKNPKFDKIRSLKPTHIMFNLEENEFSHLDEIKSISKTIVTTPTDISSTIEMLSIFGDEFSIQSKTTQKCIEINQFLKTKKKYPSFSYLYFIWNDPKMVVGKNTYIDSMLSEFGGINAASSISEKRYITLEDEEISVDKVFLSSEPFPFKEKHKSSYYAYSNSVDLIDGEMLSWHGSRTIIGLNYLSRLLGD